MAGPYVPPNRNSAKTPFINLAFDILDRDLSIETDLEGEGIHIDDLRATHTTPETPAPGPRNRGWQVDRCSTCGLSGRALRLHLQGGWLCIVCHRQLQMELGHEDEYGTLLGSQHAL